MKTAKPWAHLYDRRWRKRRAEHLRLHPLCVYCEARGVVRAASIADHIEPHRGDPIKFRGPLQGLCPPCHSGAKAELEATGRLRGHDRTGAPLDANHPWNREPDR